MGIALVVWSGGVALQHLRDRPVSATIAPWQGSFRELPPAEQRTFRHLREALAELEGARVDDGAWPAPERLQTLGIEPFRSDELSPPLGWTLKRHGIYATYLGLPAETTAQRWLIQLIEPATREPAPPEDEEHHTLPDGTPIHVTVWTQANSEPPPADDVLAFPSATGWRQCVGQ
jgi:hypothetical protein